MKPLLVIRNDVICPLGIVEQALDESRVPWRYVEAWAGESLPDVDEVSGVIVLGGVMNVDEVDRYPHLGDVRALLRRLGDAEVPALGVCLGAQMLARAYDAPVYRRKAPELGFCRIEMTPAGIADPVTAAFAGTLLFEFHEDHAELPAQAELLASSGAVEAQAFRIGRSYGVQFHFEVTTGEITAWLDHTPPGDLEELWGTTREAVLAQAAQHLEAQQVAGRRAAAAFAGLISPEGR